MRNIEISEFEPYLAQFDYILNEYLDYEFDTTGKENQSFKEFLEWLQREEKKILSKEFYDSQNNQKRYSLMRHLFTLRLVINNIHSNKMNMILRNFLTEKTISWVWVKSKIGYDICINFYPYGYKVSWENKNEKALFLKTLIKDFKLLMQSVCIPLVPLMETEELVAKYISHGELYYKIDKVELEQISDAQPVIEFILLVNEIIDSISDKIWEKHLTPLQLEHRSEKLGRLFQLYLSEYKNISDRNSDFLKELIAYRVRNIR